MAKVLIVSPRDPELDLGATIVWRGDVERVWIRDPGRALGAVAEHAPALVVIDGQNAQEAAELVRSIRFHEATRGSQVAVLDRSLSLEAETALLEAGAAVALPVPVDPVLLDARLQELLHVPPRREARVGVRLEVWSRGPERAVFEGSSVNVSLRGMLLETTHPMPLGAKLDLSFRLPGDQASVRVVGQVVRDAGMLQDRHRAGIAFLVLRGESRNRIGAFVDFARRVRVPVPEGPVPALPEADEWEAELRASEARKAAVLDSALDCVISLDTEGRIVEFNAAAERTFGCSRNQVFGRRLLDTLVPPELRDEARRRLGEFVASGERELLGGRVETTALRADGASFPVVMAVAPSWAHGRLLLTAFVREISERKRLERLAEAEREATLALAHARTVSEAARRILAAVGAALRWERGGFWLATAGSLAHVESWSAPGLRAASGSFDAAEAHVARVLETGAPEWTADVEAGARGAEAAQGEIGSLVAVPARLGGAVLGIFAFASRRPRPVEPDALARLVTLGGHVGQYLERKRGEDELARSLAELRSAQEALERLARFDPLTGLPNRGAFLENLERALARAGRSHRRTALVFADLDGFKAVNDNMGHEAGDALLRLVAQRLQAAVRAADIVARMGGDEFTILVQDLDRGEEVAYVARTVLEQLARPFLVQGREVLISASAGISVHPEDGGDSQTLLRHADLAMYRAKEDGRNTYRFFTPAMSERARERMASEAGLRRALQLQEFLLEYQPQLLDDGRFPALEALLRWRDPERGLMAPTRFIHHAEDTGLILPIGGWVLRTACRFASLLAFPEVRVAVNMSARQLLHPDFVSGIEDTLQESGLTPKRLELEVTESTIMSEAPEVAERLARLDQMGVQLTLDDFGTGYSSLSHLKRLRIHRVKIDRSFVLDLPGNADSAAIVSAIVGLARGLGVEVVAEGVETREQMQFLRDAGCRCYQGYLVSPPIPPEQVAAFLRRPQGPYAALKA